MKSLIEKFLFLLLGACAAVFRYVRAGIARILGWNLLASGKTENFLTPDEQSAIKARFAKFLAINEEGFTGW